MKRFKYLIIIMSLLMLLVGIEIPVTFGQEKYAILISAEPEPTIDDQDYHSEFWYDLFLIYQMLIESGFTHDHIYVLFGEGNDFPSGHAEFQAGTVFPGVTQIADYPNHKHYVEDIFTWIANGNPAEGITAIAPGDFLFYWWMGHGAGCACANYEAVINHDDGTQERITDNEFVAYFAQLPACIIKTQYVMTCRSGGIIEDFEGLHATVHASAECCQDCYIHPTECHAEFNYHLFNAFREEDPDGNLIASDDNGDGWVSVDETNNYVHTNTTQSNTQISDYRNLAPLVNLSDARPDVDVVNDGVYSRDYVEDNGTEPSEWMSYIWYEGPDLWVRHAQDDETTHQNAEFGQTNFVYARIHNISCNLLNNVNAELSWCLQTAWANPASWNPISTIPINNFESSESRVISAPWTDVPAPGTYCLHTVLNVPGDLANADGRAFMDNNKVQINLTVEDNVPGWKKIFPFLIENGLKEMARVDLVIEKLEFLGLLDPPKLTLEIPRDLKFDRLIGGELKKLVDGGIIEIPPKTRRAVLQGIVLEPNEKKEAVLSLVMPKKLKVGESILVKVSEQIKGREMGGIVFKTRAASQKQVMSILFRRIGNLFEMLDKNFKVIRAMEISKLCREVGRDCRLDYPKSLRRVMTEVTRLEEMTRGDLSKLMKKEDFGKLDKALQTTRMAVGKENIGLFAESQEEMIFSTKPLFLQNVTRKSLKRGD